MGRRLTRKEIKRKDPVTEALENFWQYFVANRRFLLMTITGVLIVLVLVIVGQRIYDNSVTTSSQAVEQAGKLYWQIAFADEETAADTGDETDPASVTPENAPDKSQRKNMKELQELADEFSPSGFTGTLVNYYKGISLRDTGNPEEAAQTLEATLAGNPDPEMALVVRLALAETYRRQGKYDEALKQFEQARQVETTNFPPDMILLQKSVCLEEAGRRKEAYDVMKTLRESYEEKRKENPQFASPLESQVRLRISLLEARLKADGVDLS
ncbi:MAG: tetratricopeptide repeat protein [Acidobacteria bacterium]|nr:tetratricopeptide repeat protein [Acidobacteriota bacterium]